MAIANLFSENNRERLAKEIENTKKEALKTPLQAIVASLEGMKIRADREVLLHLSTYPKMLILGEKDPIVPYEEAKDQKGVPLTPLTQMDQLGRYNIAAEMARQAGEGSPSRVEYGLNPEGMPALSGGAPRMARYGGIMAFANGGSVAMAEGGDPMIDISPENFPMKDGQIDGPGTETSDDIPAMLSDGEFVMTSKAVRGAGSFDVNDNNGILTLTPTRDSGTRVMYKLMEHFGSVA